VIGGGDAPTKPPLADAPGAFAQERRRLLVVVALTTASFTLVMLVLRWWSGLETRYDAFARDEDITKVDGGALGGRFEMAPFWYYPTRDAVRIRWWPAGASSPRVVVEVFRSGDVDPHEVMLMPGKEGLRLRVCCRDEWEVLVTRDRLLAALSDAPVIVMDGAVR
jgi:hypothetical protein